MYDSISIYGNVSIFRIDGDSTINVYDGKNAFTDDGFDYLIGHLSTTPSNNRIQKLVMAGRDTASVMKYNTITTENYKLGSKQCKFTGSFATTIEALTIEGFNLTTDGGTTYSTLTVSPFFKETGTRIYLEWTISIA